MVEPSLFTGPKEKLLNTTEDKTFDQIIYLFKNTKIIFNIIFFNIYLVNNNKYFFNYLYFY